MFYAKIDSLVESYKDELLKDMKKWISVPSVQSDPCGFNAPFGKDVRAMLDVALETAKGCGFATRDVDGYAGEISMGDGESAMGILAHLDVVPAGDGWTKDPWGAEIVGNKIFGRGTLDDKGPALMALYAMRAVKEAGVPLKDCVKLILGCDEETGMSDMRYYAKKRKMPDYGFSPDAEFPIINIEKGGLGLLLKADVEPDENAFVTVLSLYAGERPNVVPAIAKAGINCKNIDAFKKSVAEIADKYNFNLRVEGDELISEGVSAHASMPNKGKNAAGMLLIALAELTDVLPFKGLATVIGMENDGATLGIKQSDALSGALTCNAGILRYDGHTVSLQLDIRYPLCANEDDMRRNAEASAKANHLELEYLGSHTPLHVPAEHKTVRGLLKVYADVTGKDAYTIAIGGGTYSRMMPNTVAFGPCFPGDFDCCHTPDEFIEIDKMMLSVKIYAHAIAELAGGNIE